MKNKRLTLRDFIAVFGVLAVLSFMFLPSLIHYGIRESPRRSACLSNCKQFGNAIIMYSQDYNELFPRVTAGRGENGAVQAHSLTLLYNRYATDKKLFACPAADRKAKKLMAAHAWDFSVISYGYDDAHSAADASDTALVCDRLYKEGNSKNHGKDRPGQNVLFLDGHVKWQPTVNCGHKDDAGAHDNIATENKEMGGNDTWIK